MVEAGKMPFFREIILDAGVVDDDWEVDGFSEITCCFDDDDDDDVGSDKAAAVAKDFENDTLGAPSAAFLA